MQDLLTEIACAARTKHAADLVAVQLLHLHARVGRVAAGELALCRPSGVLGS